VAIVGEKPVGFASFSDYPNNAVQSDGQLIYNWPLFLKEKYELKISVFKI
jgi:hypothetical protein